MGRFLKFSIVLPGMKESMNESVHKNIKEQINIKIKVLPVMNESMNKSIPKNIKEQINIKAKKTYQKPRCSSALRNLFKNYFSQLYVDDC